MVSQFLTEHAFQFIVTGFIVSFIGGIWILFAAYQSDIPLARLTVFLFPILIYKIVLQYPEKCLMPFIVNMIGFCTFLGGIFGFWMRISGLR